MLHAHNYSLHDTVNSLKLALEVGDDSIQELQECNTAASLARLDQNKVCNSYPNYFRFINMFYGSMYLVIYIYTYMYKLITTALLLTKTKELHKPK